MGQAASTGAGAGLHVVPGGRSQSGTPPPLNVNVTQATPEQLRILQSKFASLKGGGKTRKNMKKKCSTKKRKGGKQRK